MEIGSYTISRPDIVIAAFILLCCIFGFIKGAVRQFFSILAFTIASIACFIVPYFVDFPIIGTSSPVWGYIILSVLIWIPTFLVLSFIGKFIASKLVKGKIGVGDRIWGFFFGAVKGLIIIVMLIFLLTILPNNIRSSVPGLNDYLDESKIVSVVEPYNPLLKIQIMGNLRALLYAMTDPDYMELIEDDPGFIELSNQKSIKAVLNDDEIKNDLEERQFTKFLTNPKVQALIKDQEAVKLLLTTNIEDIVVKNI